MCQAAATSPLRRGTRARGDVLSELRGEEENFFDTLRDWVWDGSVTQWPMHVRVRYAEIVDNPRKFVK